MPTDAERDETLWVLEGMIDLHFPPGCACSTCESRRAALRHAIAAVKREADERKVANLYDAFKRCDRCEKGEAQFCDECLETNGPPPLRCSTCHGLTADICECKSADYDALREAAVDLVDADDWNRHPATERLRAALARTDNATKGETP